MRRAYATALAVSVAVAGSGCAAGFSGTPTYVTDVSATINGLVGTSEGGSTSYWVEYGTSTSYAEQSSVRSKSIAERSAATVSIPIAGLTAGTLYHYRICAQDSQQGVGPGCGGDATFTTGPAGGRSGIAFYSTRGPGSEFTRSDVITMDSDGSNQTNVTNSPSSFDAQPTWSPDARRIAYVRLHFAEDEITPVGKTRIYVANADGTNPVPLTDDSIDAHQPDWSPDGRRIAFARFQSGDEEICVMDADGTHQTNLTRHPGPDAAPAWSPDGTRIAFESIAEPNDQGEIYVMNADGSNRTRLTNNAVGDAQPAWSPDGTRIAFSRRNTSLSFEIFAMDPDGGNQVDLINRNGSEYLPTWSPDGSRIAFSDPSNDIFSMSVEGGPITNLTSNAAGDYAAAWSPRP